MSGDDDGFKQALDDGLEWFVISHKLESIPDLLHAFQVAGNAPGHLSKGVTDCQCMEDIHKMVTAAEQRGLPAKFEDVKRAVLRSKPRCSDAVPWMYAYVLKYAGGANKQFLADLSSFQKAHAASKTMPANFYKEAAGFEIHPAKQTPFVATALCKRNFNSSSDKMKDGRCNAVTPAMIKSLCNNNEKNWRRCSAKGCSPTRASSSVRTPPPKA